jgi:hypothetical protein
VHKRHTTTACENTGEPNLILGVLDKVKMPFGYHIRPFVAKYQRLKLLWIFVKFSIRVLYRKSSGESEFGKNRLSDSHGLLKAQMKFCMYSSSFTGVTTHCEF